MFSFQRFFTILPTFLLVIVIIFGSYIRVQNLGESSLWIDEGYSINGAFAVQEHGYPLLESGRLYTNQPLASYMVAGSITLFGLDPYNPWSARIPSVVFGIATILAVFLFTRRLFGNDWIALGASIIIAFLPWEIAWSRQARGYTMLQFFLIASLDQLLAFMRDKKFISSVAAVVSLVLAFFSHALTIAFLPGFFFILAVWIVRNRKNLPHIALLPISIIALGTLWIGLQYIQGLTIYNYLSWYNDFITTSFPLLFGLGVTGFLFAMLHEERELSGSLLLATCAIAYVIIAAYGQTVHYRYLTALLPFISIGVAYSLFGIVATIQKIITKPNHLNTIGACCVIIVIGLLVQQNILIAQTSSTLMNGSPQPDFVGAYKYIKEEITNTDVMISPYAHLNKIYLNNPGLLLPISLTGRSSELLFTITPEEADHYTNAPVIYAPELLTSTETLDGFLLLDTMAQQRMPKEFNAFIENLAFQVVYFSTVEENGGGIWVFKF